MNEVLYKCSVTFEAVVLVGGHYVLVFAEAVKLIQISFLIHCTDGIRLMSEHIFRFFTAN